MTLLGRHTILLLLLTTSATLFACRTPMLSEGRSFATPEAAGSALMSALEHSDEEALEKILGPGSEPLIKSGDPVMDERQQTWFVGAYKSQHAWLAWNEGVMILQVGTGEWPFPIPLVDEEATWWGRRAGWRFDASEGAGELLNRRIGRNELDTIQSCLAFIDAEREYFRRNPQESATPEYARFIVSSQGEKNGLYWATSKNEPPSPLGPLYAEAQSAGYSPTQGAGKPYHGYRYRVLDAQGSSAPGGAYEYVVDGRMTQGFALLAFPAKYGVSGVMSFLVNQVGLVYEKDLGADTHRVAGEIKTFDPDTSWKLVPPGALIPPTD